MSDCQDQTPVAPPPTEPGPLGTVNPDDIPGARLSLVMGILAIALATTCWLGFIGLGLGIFGWRKSSAARVMGRAGRGSNTSRQLAEAGYVCSIIGTCMSTLAMVVSCAYAGFMLVMIRQGKF